VGKVLEIRGSGVTLRGINEAKLNIIVLRRRELPIIKGDSQ
jgi:hypothetical protein